MQEGLGFGPLEIWQSMGGVGRGVFVFLMLMSIYSFALMLDRVFTFRKSSRQSRLFVERVRRLLENGDYKSTRTEAEALPNSHLARIYRAALVDFLSYQKNRPKGFEETVQRAAEREATLVSQELKRGLGVLASIGATAPFVGLFGTVVGIMNAFFGMARTGQGGIGAVAGGIAEALVNTAVGLFVALPAVWAFNYFSTRIEHFHAEMATSGSELVDYFIKENMATK